MSALHIRIRLYWSRVALLSSSSHFLLIVLRASLRCAGSQKAHGHSVQLNNGYCQLTGEDRSRAHHIVHMLFERLENYFNFTSHNSLSLHSILLLHKTPFSRPGATKPLPHHYTHKSKTHIYTIGRPNQQSIQRIITRCAASLQHPWRCWQPFQLRSDTPG